MIKVDKITKIFGSDPTSILPLLEQGETKDSIQKKTKHVVGVHNVSFDVRKNEMLAIMGLSGSGKSTLIRCVNRLIEPTSGRIVLQHSDGKDLDVTAMNSEQLREFRRHHMSMVFQHFGLFPHRTVLSNVVYGLEVQGIKRDEREQTGLKVLDMVGLSAWAQSYPTELSGGMQQRVGIARAVATEANVLLMDEPFSALDPLIRVQMQQELRRLQSELGKTILFITHDLDEAMYIGDRIAIMEDGAIIQIGTPEEILINPQTEYVARFVEQADPTGVITAETICVPICDERFGKVREHSSVDYYARTDHPEIEFGIDRLGKLHEVVSEGRPVSIVPLAQIFDTDPTQAHTRPSPEVVLSCGQGVVVRDLLRGRMRSTLPVVVTDAEGRVRGVVDEVDLIRSILDKRSDIHVGADPRRGEGSAGGADASKSTPPVDVIAPYPGFAI